jgi:hypothetical protein
VRRAFTGRGHGCLTLGLPALVLIYEVSYHFSGRKAAFFCLPLTITERRRLLKTEGLKCHHRRF